MAYPWRRQIEYYDGFYHRDIGHYWLPYISSYQQPVFVVHIPVPVQHVATSRVQTSDNNRWGQSKSKATKLRDKQRKQKFMECKSIISSFPFYGLNDDEFRMEAVNDVKPRETQISTKLTAAEKTIKRLQKENVELNEKLWEMDLKLSSQNEEQTELQKKMEAEATYVNKLVLQNVEREREIRLMKDSMRSYEKQSEQIDKFRNSISDRLMELTTENQNFKRFIDSLPRKWKDKLR